MRPLDNLFRPLNNGIRSIFRLTTCSSYYSNLRFGPTTNAALRAEGRDKLFPDDCGRLDDGKGKLCFGDPELCRQSE